MPRKSSVLVPGLGAFALVSGALYFGARGGLQHPDMGSMAVESGPAYATGEFRPSSQSFYVKGKYVDVEERLKKMEKGAGFGGSYKGGHSYSWSSDESGEEWVIYPGRTTFGKWDDARTIKTEQGTRESWTTLYYVKPKHSKLAQFFKQIF